MSVRNRAVEAFESGTYTLNGSTSVSNRKDLSETIEDVVEQGDNLPLTIDKYSINGSRITGQNSSAITSRVWDNFPTTWSTAGSGAYAHASLPSLTEGSLVSEALVRSAPDRAVVDADVSLAELIRESPGLVRDLWDLRSKELFKTIKRSHFAKLKLVAKLNLLVQFGLMPLISDAQKLLIFQSYVERRMIELEKLKTRGLRRTIRVFDDSTVSTVNTSIHSNGIGVSAPVTRLTTRIVKVHIRWYASNWLKALSDEQTRRLAHKLVLQARVDHVTAWNLMPWSWMVDWFTNVGDFVELSRNQLDSTHSIPALMVETSTEVSHPARSWKISSKSSGNVTPLVAKHVTKERRFSPATLTARMPYLTARQTSILGSLYVARFI